MRALAVGFSLATVVAVVATVQTPTSAQSKPVGNLIQIMRGSVFRDANLIFDVQSYDPGAPVKPLNETGSTTNTFSNVYTGWQVVENAAVMLDEEVDVMLKPRACQNGIPVPVTNPVYRKTAEGLRVVARNILSAAQAKNRDKVNELAGDLSDACAACHQVFRDPEGPKGFGDTSVRCKVPAAK